MKQKVYPMVPGCVQTPKRVFNAKRAVSEWEILRRGIERKPNPLPTVRSSQQFVVDDIRVVVPQESSMPDSPVYKDCHCRQENSENQGATARGKNAPRDFVHTLAAGDHDQGDKAPPIRRIPKPFTRNFEGHP
jgi:hypothetical protein